MGDDREGRSGAGDATGSRGMGDGSGGDSRGGGAAGASPGRSSRVAARYAGPLGEAVQRSGGGGDDPPTVHDVATAAVDNKAAGRAVDTGVAGRVGAHLGHDFSSVKVHDDPLARQATAAMGARAFAHGGDVFLGPGESDRDLGLMAHELTHVAQQGAAAAAMPQRKVTVGDANSPAEQQADTVAAEVTGGQGRPASLLVDDGPVQPGQMLKSTFIGQLRPQVTAAAAEELGPVWSVVGCPYIERTFDRYSNQPAAAGEAMLRRYAPATRGVTTAAAMIPIVVARVRQGVQHWQTTGQPPADLAAADPALVGGVPPPEPPGDDGDGVTSTGPDQAAALRAPDGAPTLASLEAELGPGQPLDAGVAARMSSALDADLGSVRLHTGERAARKAADAGATAFAAGPHVVMGAGQYQPGTVEGDALLAHELAHVAQQAPAASAPGARHVPLTAESGAAEGEADQATVAAMARIHGVDPEQVGGAGRVRATGLQLQRCGNPPKSGAKTGHVPSGSVASGTDLMKGTGGVSDSEKTEVDKVLRGTTGPGGTTPAFIKPGFDTDMKAALDKWRTATTKQFKKLKGPDAYKLDMPQVRKTGQAAQQVVTAEYGDYVKGATFHADTNARKPGYDVGSTSVLHEQKETVDGVPASSHDGIAIGLVRYATVQKDGGRAVMDSHHVDRSRSADKLEYNRVVQAYARAHKAELLQIQRDWPGEEHPWDGTVYIRLENMKNKKLEAKEKAGTAGYTDANLRRGYWKSFQTLIHEYLHACAHAKLQDASSSGVGVTHQVLIEGGCDYFTEKVWKKVEPTLAADAVLREKVEGKKYPYKADVIPTPGYYDEKEDVKKIVAKLGAKGEANFRAAYFMGHVDLIGLGPRKAGADKDDGVFIAPVDNFLLADVAKRCNVKESQVAADNSLKVGDKVSSGTRLKVPGVRHHIAIENDTFAAIAKQHGVTEAGLKQANPIGATIYAGRDLVIPVH